MLKMSSVPYRVLSVTHSDIRHAAVDPLPSSCLVPALLLLLSRGHIENLKALQAASMSTTQNSEFVPMVKLK